MNKHLCIIITVVGLIVAFPIVMFIKQTRKQMKEQLIFKNRITDLKVVNSQQKFYQVVSFALYGNHKRYTDGAIKNAELVKTIYPGWVCRFYHDSTVPKEILNQLLEMGSELVNMEQSGLSEELGGMFWRFLVALDEKVDRYIVRDVDSRLSAREAAAVKEWIESGFSFHSMRDHRNHDFPLNGGMWGGVKGGIPNFLSKIEQWKGKTAYLADMGFLGTLWQDIKDKTLSHDAYFCNKYPNCRDFPTPRPGDDHVGLVPPWE